MVKDITACVVAASLGIACLALLTLGLMRDSLKDMDVGPFDD